MIILDERSFLVKNLENQGFDLFDFFVDHQVLNLRSFEQLPLQRRADFLLVDTQTLLDHKSAIEGFKTVANTFAGIIFFHETDNKKALEWVGEQAAFQNKIIGQHELPMTPAGWNILSNQLNFLWTLLQEQKALQNHMIQFSQELDQVLQSAESEMIKARKIHEVLVPKRSDEIKGIHFMNRYSAGEGGGGEFYDLIQSGTNIYQILLSSQSYLISSALIGLMNQHRQKDFNIQAFLRDALAEIDTINSTKKKRSEVDLNIIEIDTINLTFKMIHSGNSTIYSFKKGLIPIELETTRNLERGDKVLVLSPGFIHNWKESQTNDLSKYLNDHQHLSSSEILLELFYEIKKSQNGEFLAKDSTVVMMEVNRHGIHKI
jgi:hypothetical protein